VMACDKDRYPYFIPRVRAHDQRGCVVNGTVPDSAALLVRATGEDVPGGQPAIELSRNSGRRSGRRVGRHGRTFAWSGTRNTRV
jgi:hypothetical protein